MRHLFYMSTVPKSDKILTPTIELAWFITNVTTKLLEEATSVKCVSGAQAGRRPTAQSPTVQRFCTCSRPASLRTALVLGTHH